MQAARGATSATRRRLATPPTQVFGVLAALSLISLRGTQAANFELSQKLLEAGERQLRVRLLGS